MKFKPKTEMKTEFWQPENPQYWRERYIMMMKAHTFAHIIIFVIAGFTNQYVICTINAAMILLGLLARHSYKKWATPKGKWN